MKYFGIVLKKEKISNNVFLYTPHYKVGGNKEGINFISGSVKYKVVDKAELLSPDDDIVAFVISEDELNQKYNSSESIEKKLAKYYISCVHSVFIGIVTNKLLMVSLLDYNIFNEKVIKHTFLKSPLSLIPSNDDFILINQYKEILTILKGYIKRLNNVNNNEDLDSEIRMVMEKLYCYGEYMGAAFRYDTINDDAVEEYYNGHIDFLITVSDTFLSSLSNIDLSNEEFKKNKKKMVEVADDYILKILEKIKSIKFDNSVSVDNKEAIEDIFNPIKYELNVKKIKAYFDEIIIGQEKAKRDVISSILINKISDNVSLKNTCLLIGPTGSGKTLIAKTASEYFDLPMIIIDSTQLSQPGYEGANIEDFLLRLIDKADGNVEKAQKGIVVFNEIDKKGSDKNNDVSGRGVINTLLSFIEGTTYSIKSYNKTILFDTTYLTVIATGTFSNVFDAVYNRNNQKLYSSTNIGFSKDDNLKHNDTKDYNNVKINDEDLVSIGKMPVEFIGRCNVITQLSNHNFDSLKAILLKSKESPLLNIKQIFSAFNVELNYTDGFINAVVEEALKLNEGARSLKKVLEEKIELVRWEIMNNEGIYTKVLLTENTVSNNLDCILFDKEGNEYNLNGLTTKEKVKSIRMNTN